MAKTDVLAHLLRFSNWANEQILRALAALSEEQLDADPTSGGEWSLRRVLIHLVEAQQGYLSLLTSGPVAEIEGVPAFGALSVSLSRSGDGLLALVRDGSMPEGKIESNDGYVIEPWVVMVQAVNHANDHRRQMCGMLQSLGVTPPSIDGWTYGEAMEAIRRVET